MISNQFISTVFRCHNSILQKKGQLRNTREWIDCQNWRRFDEVKKNIRFRNNKTSLEKYGIKDKDFGVLKTHGDLNGQFQIWKWLKEA